MTGQIAVESDYCPCPVDLTEKPEKFSVYWIEALAGHLLNTNMGPPLTEQVGLNQGVSQVENARKLGLFSVVISCRVKAA